MLYRTPIAAFLNFRAFICKMDNVNFLFDCVAKGKLSSEQAKSLMKEGQDLQVIPKRVTSPATAGATVPCIQLPSSQSLGGTWPCLCITTNEIAFFFNITLLRAFRMVSVCRAT